MRRLIVVALLALAGCATSHVTPTGKDTYLASVRFCGICTASTLATETADKYCAARGQVATVTNVQTVFGSGAADVRFSCSSAAEQKPSRIDNGISSIEVRSSQ
jgi:hypothetical protein